MFNYKFNLFGAHWCLDNQSYITKSYFTIATDPSSTLELKSKLGTSNFQESSGIENESKSFGIEASVVEKDDEKPPITGMCL